MEIGGKNDSSLIPATSPHRWRAHKPPLEERGLLRLHTREWQGSQLSQELSSDDLRLQKERVRANEKNVSFEANYSLKKWH